MKLEVIVVYLEGHVDPESRRGRKRLWVVGDDGGAKTSSGSTGGHTWQWCFQGGIKQSLLLGYLHSKQEKEEQLWAEGARPHCKHQGLMGELSPGEKR